MKKIITLLCLSLMSSYVSAQSQNLPYLGTATIIPSSPTTADIVKIVTHVTTPNQGIIVDLNHSVTHATKQIMLHGCYWNGMLTATQTHIDTFVVGQLQAGTYTVQHRAYMSSGQQVCHRTDSNIVQSTLTVGALTGLNEIKKEKLNSVFPNPATHTIYFTNNLNFTNALIYSSLGTVVKSVTQLKASNELHIEELPAGVYFVRLFNDKSDETVKFIKIDK